MPLASYRFDCGGRQIRALGGCSSPIPRSHCPIKWHLSARQRFSVNVLPKGTQSHDGRQKAIEPVTRQGTTGSR